MSNRVISTTLTLNSAPFIAGLGQTGSAASRFATDFESKVSKSSGAIDDLSNKSLKTGAVIGGMTLLAVKGFADFDQSMSDVAATGEDARGSIDKLRDAAIDYGASTKYSATEAAGGIEALLKAGVSAQDTLGGGLKGALDLAASGNMSVADSAEAAATAVNQFNLAGADVPHIADLLAAGAGKAQGEVSDMAAALKNSGSIAAGFGISIEETTGALALFASTGLIGAEAGTNLKSMLMALASPSVAAQKTMDRLGISAYDAQGNFVGLTDLAGQLQEKLGGLTQEQRNAALSTIFGSFAIQSATKLYNAGADGVAKWTDEVNDSGYAAEVASIKMDNLKGDLETMKGALETAFISAGSGGNEFLRNGVQELTKLIDKFNELSPEAQQAWLKVGAGVAALLLLAGAAGKVTTSLVATRESLTLLGTTFPKVGAAMGSATALAGPLALAFMAVVAAVKLGNDALDHFGSKTLPVDDLTKQLQSLSDQGKSLDDAFVSSNWADQLQGALTDGITPADDLQSALRGLVVAQDTWAGKIATLRESITPGTQSLEAAGDQVKNLDSSLAQMTANGHGDDAAKMYSDMAKKWVEAGGSSERLLELFPQLKAAQEDAASSSKQVGDSAQTTAEQLGAQGDAAGASADDIAAMTKELYAAANAQLTLSGNTIGVEAAMDTAAETIKKNGETLDLNTEKGRNNQTALDSLAASTLKATEEMNNQGVAAEKIVVLNDRAKESWIKSAEAAGMNGKKARELADSLFTIPPEVQAQVVVSGANIGEKEAKQVNSALKSIPKEKRAEIVTIAQTKGAKAAFLAMAEVKSKEVLASTKGDPKKAKEVKAEMDKLKDKMVTALAKGDYKGATKAIAEMGKLKNKTVTATVKESGADSAQARINAIHGKTVVVTTVHNVKKATASAGGMITDTGVLYRSEGGPVWGAGTATSDSIAALLSNGEFVIKAKSVQSIGPDRLAYMNQYGKLPTFAGGGLVGYATGGQVDLALLQRMIAAIVDPLATVAANTRAVAAASAAQSRAQATLTKEQREYAKAVAADKKADAAVKNAKSKKGKKAAGKREDATQKAKEKAAKELAAAQDKLKQSQSNSKQAVDALRSAQEQFVSQAKSNAAQLMDQYKSGSTDPRDQLAAKQQGVADLTKLSTLVDQLTEAGYNQQGINDILEMNTGTGIETAQGILKGGKAMIDALNKVQAQLDKAAEAVGYKQAKLKLAGGGLVDEGPAGIDQVRIMATRCEFMQSKGAVDYWGVDFMRAINNKQVPRELIDRTTYTAERSYVSGGGGSSVDSALLIAAIQAGLQGMTLQATLDGKPFDAMITNAFRSSGRSLARSA